MRTSSWTCTGNDVAKSIAVNVACGHAHAPGECWLKSEEASEQSQTGPVEHFHVRTTARSRSSNDISKKVGINETRPNVYATLKVWVIGEEALQQVQIVSIEDFHMRTTTWSGARNDVCNVVAINVTGCHAHSTQERR